jgi:D-glycero-D-manno-heptose 1,7-bisphosphate phosphatase
MKAVFLDRDSTIIAGIPKYDRVDSVDKVELLPHTLQALQELSLLDYKVFIVTNQAGIAEGRIGDAEFITIHHKVLELVAPSGIRIEQTYVCPHGENDGCECRKPKPKLLLDAAAQHGIDLQQSWMVGDRETDVLAGINAGTRAILVKTGDPAASSDMADFTAPTLLEAVRYIARQQ